ncbi:hypothetical protein [Paenibacillus illinoisensis]|uniref:hypothetical protein n=1 Tax=Paenibacillus illinoisensis TaxID=59845 RepID=UPI00203B1D18|nr:hypothetical protein [Paenibacillus illinoisensis]MCM3202907.1 hypothetical protein [Paenibacillus illinoisensis]
MNEKNEPNKVPEQLEFVVDSTEPSEGKQAETKPASVPQEEEVRKAVGDVDSKRNLESLASTDLEAEKVGKIVENRQSQSSQRKSQSKSPRANTKPEDLHPGELDFELKLRFKKILWAMGHYARIDVKVASYGEYLEMGRRDGIAELTDIDVWGLNFHDDFQVNNIVVDCKNGEKVSPAGRIFWIKGLMEYVGNARGYMVMGKKVIPTHLRETANRFNISLMDGKNLIVLERMYDIDRFKDLEVFSGNYISQSDKISDKSIKELLDYRKYNYWIDEDHTKLHNVIGILSSHASKLSGQNKNHQVVVLDLIGLFTIALFKLCNFIVRTTVSDIKMGTLLFLYNGAYNLDKYVTVTELFEKILKNAASNYGDIQKFLDYKPVFFDDLVELCITIIRRPNESKDILRYIDAAIYCNLYPTKLQKKSLKEVFGAQYNEITAKLMFDIVDFINKNTKIDKRLIPKSVILGNQG